MKQLASVAALAAWALLWAEATSAGPPGPRRFGPYLGPSSGVAVRVAPVPSPFVGPGYGIYSGYVTYGPWPYAGWYRPWPGYYYSFRYQPYSHWYYGSPWLGYDAPLAPPLDPPGARFDPPGARFDPGGQGLPPPEELPPPDPDAGGPGNAGPEGDVPGPEDGAGVDRPRSRPARRAVRVSNDETRARAWRIIRQGDRSFSTGRFAQAIEHYASAVRNAPDIAEAHLRRGQAHVALGRYPSAAASFKQALLLRFEPAELQFDLAKLYAGLPLLRMGHLDTVRAAEEETPGSADLMLVLGMQLAYGNNPALARGVLEQAARRYRTGDAELAEVLADFIAALPPGEETGSPSEAAAPGEPTPADDDEAAARAEPVVPDDP